MRRDPGEIRPTFRGILVAIVIGALATGVAGEVALRILYPNWREYSASRFMQPVWVAGHGWLYVGKPGFDGHFAQNNGDFRHRLRINGQGLRNDEPAGEAGGRFWAIGDSVTFGWGVEREQTFGARAALLAHRPFFSVASPGADICGYQALVARMPKGVKPQAAVVGLVLENDLDGADCEARKGENPEALPAERQSWRPSALLQAGKLALMKHSALYNFLAIQLKKWGWLRDSLVEAGLVAREHVMHNVFPESELEPRIEAAARELARLKDLLPPHTPFAVLVVPARFDIRDGEPLYVRLRERITVALAARGITVLDPLQPLKAAGFAPTHFAHDGHWSPAGHDVAARVVAAWLEGEARP